MKAAWRFWHFLVITSEVRSRDRIAQFSSLQNQKELHSLSSGSLSVTTQRKRIHCINTWWAVSPEESLDRVWNGTSPSFCAMRTEFQFRDTYRQPLQVQSRVTFSRSLVKTHPHHLRHHWMHLHRQTRARKKDVRARAAPTNWIRAGRIFIYK